MTGTTRDGRPILLRLDAVVDGPLVPWGEVTARASGRLTVGGLADDVPVTGTIEIAPLTRRRIRYRLSSGDHRLDGWKSIDPRRPVRSMTTLPVTISSASGQIAAEGVLRFDLRRDLLPFLGGLRPGGDAGPDPLASRWRGRPGRLEVWYSTLSDPVSGAGVWIHHELVAPADGSPAYTHGWAAVFPADGPPVLGRFGPDPLRPGAHPFSAGEVTMGPATLTGRAGDLGWRLTRSGGGDVLYTFPAWAWRREILPAAQIVTAPAARFTGTVSYGGRRLDLDGAPGATARIYGHGNARTWGWLHADLGGGDVLEIVAAVSTRPGLNRLRPLPLLRLRVDGRDWPAGDPLLNAARFTARLGLPHWSVRGRVGDRRISVTVTLPPGQTLAVDYADPDGAPAVCHNSERASATVVVETRAGGRWRREREWRLDGTAHAEIGSRDAGAVRRSPP
ncbi:hypothetical protein GCM10010156_32280 [Planobispora rosea]|uniref:Uncharacterized protein n=1 Tax=Planobispora rosea TaxID=35762 RepID=A0A8J3WEY0_PLARO|nr:hypothetical protein [Planobispora rosea]GGS70956.1 hypothetical protein GCM10010156_32280 [Planobispora rosea]GIH85411.1 hypothetical protein Pro02_38190 [Planobispora rosea]